MRGNDSAGSECQRVHARRNECSPKMISGSATTAGELFFPTGVIYGPRRCRLSSGTTRRRRAPLLILFISLLFRTTFRIRR